MIHRTCFLGTKFSPCTSVWCTVFLKLLDRKLHCGEAWLSRVSRRQSVSKRLPLAQRTKCACKFCVGSKFSKCRYSSGWTKGKGDLLSPWRVQKKFLKHLSASLLSRSMSAASGALTLAAACTPETSTQNFITSFPDGVAVFCVVLQCYFWLVMVLNKLKGNMKKVHIFHLFCQSVCMFLE